MESKELLKYIYHIAKNNGITLNVTKLMKLMYFCDGVFLAYGKNIVNENAKAWEHGPVYPKAYKYICNKKDHNEEPEMYLPSTEEEIKECLDLKMAVLLELLLRLRREDIVKPYIRPPGLIIRQLSLVTRQNPIPHTKTGVMSRRQTVPFRYGSA